MLFNHRMPLARFGVFLSGMIASAIASAQTVYAPDIAVDHVATNLGGTPGTLTTSVCFVDARTMLAVRRDTGRVHRVDLPAAGGAPATLGPIVLDLDLISPQSDNQSEYGVQGIELHPNFARNGLIYVRYDRSPTPGVDTPQSEVILSSGFSGSEPTENVIERYVWLPHANGGSGALMFDAQIYSVTVDTRYHHGSPMVFMQDGTLMTCYGDLRRSGNGGIPIAETAGYLMSTNMPAGVIANLGIIVRMNDDGTAPADNPFNGQTGLEYWYGYGFRNGFGIDVDPVTGALWATHNGENLFDEINQVAPGHNDGWYRLAGPTDHPLQGGSKSNLHVLPGSQYSEPEFSWVLPIGVTAVHFAYGSALGEAYDDLVLVGGYNVGHLWGFRMNEKRNAFVLTHPDLQDLVDDRPNARAPLLGTEAEETAFGEGFGDNIRGILTIERGLDGSIYLLNAFGNLHRLRPVIECFGDMTGDQTVNLFDLLALLSAWGTNDPASDLNTDQTVNLFDLLALFGAWGPC